MIRRCAASLACAAAAAACASPATRTYCTLQDGRTFAGWVDAGPPPGEATRSIWLQFVTGPYAGGAPWRLTGSAAASSPLQIEPLLDGGALAMAALVDADGRARIHFFRLEGRRWRDGGDSVGRGALSELAPGGGARFAVDGGRVAVAWSARTVDGTAIAASFSPDAAARFLAPLALPLVGAPPPRFDVALLHDGAMVVAAATARGIEASRISPAYEVDPSAPLALPASPGGGRIALAIVRDYAGGMTAARLEVSWSLPARGEITFRLPEGELLKAANRDCHCAPTPDELLGYSIRGKVLRSEGATVTLDVEAAPGLMEPGAHAFRYDAHSAAAPPVGASCLGRIRRLGNAWELFDLRTLGP